MLEVVTTKEGATFGRSMETILIVGTGGCTGTKPGYYNIYLACLLVIYNNRSSLTQPVLHLLLCYGNSCEVTKLEKPICDWYTVYWYIYIYIQYMMSENLTLLPQSLASSLTYAEGEACWVL